MKIPRLLLLSCLALFPVAVKAAQPVLLELFTSQGCSSCPPAEEVLNGLLANPDPANPIIALAFHVDYWDRLGWKDRYASPGATARQYRYAESFKSDRVYTPQLILNGTVEFLGSNRDRADRALKAAQSTPRATIELQMGAPENPSARIAISKLQALKPADAIHLYCALTEDHRKDHIERGENAGRTLHQMAVVRHLQDLGPLPPGEDEFTTTLPLTLDPEWNVDRLNLVVFLQSNGIGPILGLTAKPIRPRP
ncbi:MAG: DUF1223 domain-containing protein [Candidatus Hydrogenedentes bacterium]|nr:DUF1223 domain-containing protein [Candidatus Hydrogenedentota bacterium]